MSNKNKRNERFNYVKKVAAVGVGPIPSVNEGEAGFPRHSCEGWGGAAAYWGTCTDLLGTPRKNRAT